MARYNLTRVAPDGFIHHQAFAEIQDSLAWALTSLGHEVSVTQNWFAEFGETNIILGAELIGDFQRLPKNSIVYNLEQPSHPNMEKVRRLVRESGCRVWDYSRRSVDEWKALGFNVAYLPVGYTPNLTRITPSFKQDIDVLFTGWMTPRRSGMIQELKKSGLNVLASSSCYGGARDQLISRSKVCLNIHHDGRDRFEIVRCSYLMANSKLVVTEVSSDDDEYESLRNGLARGPYRILADTCASYCRDGSNQERRMMEEKAFELIERLPFQAVLSDALDYAPPQSSASFKMSRTLEARNFLAEARSISPLEAVASRYASACQSGDMKDFVPWLREHAKGNILEIGVRDGASTSAFLAGVEEHGGHVYSVDMNPCGSLFQGHPQWTFIHASSIDTAYTIPLILPNTLDVLLIDGSHTSAGVSSDWYSYSPLVKAGGLILFHDITPEPNPGNVPDWPDDSVKKFYEDTCKESGWEHEEIPGRYGLGVLHKPVGVPA